MTVPTNILRQVQTYQDAGLAFLQNSYVLVNKSNKKFLNFQNEIAQLGQTVTFEKPYRSRVVNSLVVAFEPTEMRYETLTVDQQASVAKAFDVQQFVYTVEDYMQKIGKGAVAELGAAVESNLAQNIIDHTYRFYGDGVTAIDSFGQLATSLAYFRNYGSAREDTRGILPDINVPAIVSSGLAQFVMKRNEDIAMSWELGTYSNCEWSYSNLLPVHTAGTIGQSRITTPLTPILLTVVSTNDPSGAAITQITCTSSGAANDPDAIKAGDLLYFNDGVTGQPDLRYMTFIGHKISANKVQIRATADAATVGGTVVINISPTLDAVADQRQNINANIVAGMTLYAIPSHRAGLIYSGNALYLAMPRLPEEVPYPTSNSNDPDSGASLRMYYGSLFGQNQRGMIHDCIWGSTLVDEYAMRVCFPL